MDCSTQASLSITNSRSLLKLMSIESVMPSNLLISCCLLPPQSFPASGSFPMSQFFASGGQSIGTFSFNISTSNEYSRLKAFRIDWLDLLAVQGTLKSLLQHHLCLGGVREVISWPHFANEETETRKRKYISQGHEDTRKVKPGLNPTACGSKPSTRVRTKRDLRGALH